MTAMALTTVANFRWQTNKRIDRKVTRNDEIVTRYHRPVTKSRCYQKRTKNSISSFGAFNNSYGSAKMLLHALKYKPNIHAIVACHSALPTTKMPGTKRVPGGRQQCQIVIDFSLACIDASTAH